MVSSLGEGSRATSRLPTAGEVAELMCSEQVRVLGQATVAFLFLKTTWLQKKSDQWFISGLHISISQEIGSHSNEPKAVSQREKSSHTCLKGLSRQFIRAPQTCSAEADPLCQHLRNIIPLTLVIPLQRSDSIAITRCSDNFCIEMFITMIFTIAKIRKEPMSKLGKRLNKL